MQIELAVNEVFLQSNTSGIIGLVAIEGYDGLIAKSFFRVLLSDHPKQKIKIGTIFPMPVQKLDENWISNTLVSSSKHSCQQKISGNLMCYCVLNSILFVVQQSVTLFKLPGLHLCISSRQVGAGSTGNVVINIP
jgi:hypothetical protein